MCEVSIRSVLEIRENVKIFEYKYLIFRVVGSPLEVTFGSILDNFGFKFALEMSNI